MKRFFNMKKFMILMAVAALVLVLAAPQVFAGEYWLKKYERFSATAGATLAAGDAVCIKGSDGKAYKADANDSTLRPAVGVIGKGGASAAVVEIVTRGVLGGQTAASPGVRLFLSETAGALTITEPTNGQVMGFVMPGTAGTYTSTKYFIKVEQPASAGAGY